MYKICKVVMLPTNEKALLELNLNTHKLDQFMGFANDAHNYIPAHDRSFKQFHNLYIISDDEIKEGDFAIIDLAENSRVVKIKSLEGNHPIFSVDIKDGYAKPDSLKKVIASTDKSLGLSTLPSTFIELFISEYNKQNIINKVKVDYILDDDEITISKYLDGSIVIGGYKQVFIREEVISLLNECWIQSIRKQQEPNTQLGFTAWLNNNL